MKERRLVVSDNVIKYVLLHREKFDGSGFPNKKAGKQFLPEAQILGLACMIDKMTCVKEGQASMNILQAVHLIYNESRRPLERSPFEPELLGKLMKLFPSEGTVSS